MKKLFLIALLGGGLLGFTSLAEAQTCEPISGGGYYCEPATNPPPTDCVVEDAGGMICETEIYNCPTCNASVPPGTAPRGTLRANFSSVTKGQLVTLTWETTNTSGCEINGDPAEPTGIKSIPISQTTTFRLECFDRNNQPGGRQLIASVQVTAQDPAPAPAPAAPTADPRCPPGTKAGDLCYVPLEPLPGVNQTGQATFADLIGGFFRILINIGAFVAVTVLVIGGITYMVSEKTFSKLAAKEKIKAAFWGLAILGSSWLILNTVNPELLQFDKSIVGSAPGAQTAPRGVNNATTYICFSDSSKTREVNYYTVKNDEIYASINDIQAFTQRCGSTGGIVDTNRTSL